MTAGSWGGFLGWVPPGGAIGLGRSGLVGGDGVVACIASGLEAEPRSAEVLGMVRSSTEQARLYCIKEIIDYV